MARTQLLEVGDVIEYRDDTAAKGLIAVVTATYTKSWTGREDFFIDITPIAVPPRLVGKLDNLETQWSASLFAKIGHINEPTTE